MVATTDFEGEVEQLQFREKLLESKIDSKALSTAVITNVDIPSCPGTFPCSSILFCLAQFWSHDLISSAVGQPQHCI